MTRPLLAALAALLAVSCEGPEPELVAATAQPLAAATYAGKTSNPELYAAVITSEDGVEAYLCDGVFGAWFRGAGTADSVMDLEGADGARLLLQLDDGTMHGRLIAADEAETDFELPEVQGEVLFRAETMAGDVPVLGGWIVLPDGTQRGVVKLGALASGSSLTNGVVQCAACAAVSLAPAAFVPGATQKRPNVLQRVTIVGLGDSYMSGEGAPVVDGAFNADGTMGTQERWSDGLPQSLAPFTFALTTSARARLEREARACHRGAAGLGLAVGELQQQYPFAHLLHQTFACSGAQVKHAINTPYGGPGGCEHLTGSAQTDCLAVTDDVDTPSIRPQLPEALEFVRDNGLNLDAVVMSIGGNDLGFGYVIADCLQSMGSGCEAPDSEARRVLAEGSAFLPGEYDRLATALASAGVPDGNVFLAAYPSPLRRTATDNCSGFEFDDALLRFVSDEEAQFAGGVHTSMNQLVTAGATRNGWRAVTSHVGTEVGHAMCNAAPWFNDTQTALRTQGADLPPQAFGLVRVSAGMVHPNRAGHRDGYRPAYKAALDELLRRRFTPRVPQRVRVTKLELVNGRGVVTVAWDDMNLFEQRTVLRAADGATLATVGADRTTASFQLDGTTGTVSVEACVDNPVICSPRSAVLTVDVKRPDTRPTSPTAALTLLNTSTTPRQIRLAWSDRVPTRVFSTVELDVNGTLSTRAVEGQDLLLPEATNLTRFRVATCNQLGCGPVTPWVSFDRPATNILPPCDNPVLNGCRK